MSYLLKEYHQDLSFSQIFLEANIPIYDILGHQLRMNMSEAQFSAYNRTNYDDRKDHRYNPAY